MIELKGKNALITGSSRGIVKQIALGLAQHGCNIILHGRTLESTKNTYELLEGYNIEIYNVFGDLSDDNEINDLINQVNDLNISVNILYNNAAIMRDYRHDIWAHTTEDWLSTFQINVVAMYKLCSAFIPQMIENNFGRVINLTSRISNQPQLAPYGASKWAVDKLTQDLAFSVKDTSVRINYLNPSWLKTDMGGEHAEHPVEAVLPGALAPALIDDDGPNGECFSAIENSKF